MRFRTGINFSLLMLSVLPATLIGFVMVVYFVNARVADIDASLRERGDHAVKELAAAAASELIAGNVKVLQDLTDSIIKENDVIGVEVWSTTQKMAASKTHLATHGKTENQLVLGAPVVRPDTAAPLHESPSAGEPIGSARLVLSRQETLKKQRETILHALWIGAGGLSIAASLAYRLGRRISSPILSLTTAVHAVSEGNLEVRAQTPAGKELAYLQAGFNAMAAELQKNRQNLEQQVQDATRQLQNTLKSLEKRNAELDVARRNAELQTALKSQFLAQMSHEIRTPMSGILGFAELLAQSPLTVEQNEKLSLIERSAKNLLAIINEVLDLAKLEAGKISLNIHLFMLRPYLEDAIALQMQRFRHLPIILWIAPDVPATVLGDPIRIQQVINNLLGNALKFTQQGRIVIRVRLQKQGTAPRLLFSVSDSGRGISLDDQAQLFLPFQQLSDYAADRERGAGLGLSIANNIVDKMGGQLHVASRVGRGTTFWFDLPITNGTSDEHRLPKHAAVALIDADKLYRQALRYQLEALGASVTCFSSCEEFVSRYQMRTHGALVFINATAHQEHPETSLACCLDQATRLGARPVVILQPSDRRLREFYRQAGATCLLAPVHSERLRSLLLHQIEAHAKRAADQRPASPDLLGRKVLIADDNEINRILLGAQLSGMGASIESAHDGLEALAASRSTPYDLIILDLQMPGMDGIAVIRELQTSTSVNRQTPILAITAHAQPAQRAEVLEAGFAGCLIKPILEEQLRELLPSLLGPPRSLPAPSSLPAQPHVVALLDKTSGNRQLALTIARKLFTELPRQLRELTDAFAQNDLQTAREITHKIHGSSAFCGLEEIRQAAGKLEDALAPDAELGDFEGSSANLIQAVQAFLAMEPTILEALGNRPEMTAEG